MNRKPIIIAVLIIIAISIIGYVFFFMKPTPYLTKEKCEQATGKECYLSRDLCQVSTATTQAEEEANEKYLRDCLPKRGTWQPIETVSPNE